MGNFNRDNNSGFRRGGGFSSNRDRGFGDRSERPTMHKAICDNCGKECEVPFRPTSGKPIYCSSCFESKRGSDPRNSDSRGSGDRNFRRPYENNPQPQSPSQPQNNQQLEELNKKLDRILRILEPIVATEIANVQPEEVIKEEVIKEKVVKTGKKKPSKKSPAK